MVRIYGTINSNILWEKESLAKLPLDSIDTETNLLPEHGSIRLKISSIAWGNTNFSVDYSKDTEYVCHLPYLDISYDVAGNSLIKHLVKGNNVILEVFKSSIYKKDTHFTTIQEADEGQKLINYLKCKEKPDMENIKMVQLVNTLSPQEYVRKIISTSEVLHKLVDSAFISDSRGGSPEVVNPLVLVDIPKPILKSSRELLAHSVI